MSVKIAQGNTFKVFQYTNKVVSTNENFTPEDAEWVTENFVNMYNKISENVYSMYLFLTLINQKSFCGYFSRIYNNSIFKSVKERNQINLLNLMLHPVSEEFQNNTSLSEDENTDLKELLSLEVFTTNLTVKRLTLSVDNIDNFEKVYSESYKDIYNKLFKEKIKTNRADFQNYTIITEVKNNIEYANAFFLHDILSNILLTNSQLEHEDVIKEKYNLELKLVYHTLKYYTK